MIEPEMAFYDIIDNMDLAEAFCKYLIAYVLEHNATDLAFLDQRLKEEEKSLPADKRRELGLIEQLEFVVNNDFVRITYDEAVAILMQSKPYKKGQFEFPVEWGRDLQAEHERYLVEKEFKSSHYIFSDATIMGSTVYHSVLNSKIPIVIVKELD